MAMRENLADVPADPAARERRPWQVVAGADPLRLAYSNRRSPIAVIGAVVREALAAAE